MKVKCDYCDSYFEDSESSCPHCGAANRHVHRTTSDTPKTIAELQEYCSRNGLTPEKTRFFIGTDYQGARAFGIFRNSAGEYVVYKNKDDGSRNIRYQGMDEAYAVNELYQRLQTEILNQKNRYVNHKMQKANASLQQSHRKQKRRRRGGGASLIPGILVCVVAFVMAAWMSLTGKEGASQTNKRVNVPQGYYYYDDTYYYHNHYSDSWYYWRDEVDDWQYNSSLGDRLPDNIEDYLEAEEYVYNSDYTDFEDSFWYSPPPESTYADRERDESSAYDRYDDDRDDWDSDWSSSDWDSGYTDWDSDW